MQNIHPPVVHFPIALLLAAIAFEIASLIWKRDSFRSMATGTLILGALGAGVAMVTGLQAGEIVPHPDAAHEILETHETLGIAAFSIAATLAALRLLRLERYKVLHGVFLLGLIVLGCVILYGSFLGGRLVYDFGIGTALVHSGTDGEGEDTGGRQHGDHH